MCGILCVATRASDDASAALVRSGLASLAHRGPDAQGVRVVEGQGVTAALGVTRLRVIDASPASDQPIGNETGDVWVAFNGEIYNFTELRADLQRAGHMFRSPGDTEVLVHLYEAVGGDVPAMLERLRGMFAFVLFDATRGRLVAARDRLGIKPLYFCRVRDGLAFASEARALVRAGFQAGEPNPHAVASYLARGVVPGTFSIFAGVETLAPAHFVDWERGQHEVRRWWAPSLSPAPDLAHAEDATRLMRAVLEDAVGRHLVADRPLGVFLSGGLDSRVVLSLCAKAGARVRALTVTFPETPAADEGREAADVAAAWGADHTPVAVSSAEVLTLAHEALSAMDQPSWDAFNSWLVCRAAAAEGLVVCLSGIGGDELFGGYPSFTLVERVHALRRAAGLVPALGRRRVVREVARWSPGSRLTRALDAEAGVAGAYDAVRGLFSASELASCLPADWRRVAGPARGEERPRGTIAERVGLLEMTHYLPDQLLRDADAMSMAHSLELRVPLLDDLVVRAALAVPGHVRLEPGKALLARAAGLPPQATKRTFALPMDTWMRGPLRDTVREALLSDALPLSATLAPAWRRHLWEGFDHGRTHWSRPWAVAVLRLWPGANGLRW